MDKYGRFDKYFICSYYNEINELVGVFSKNTPEIVLAEARRMFDIIELSRR